MININEIDAPQVLKDFLIYMLTIKGKSINTVKEYFYDLRTFFRFLILHKNIVSKNISFNEIKISGIDIGFLKDVKLSDLYSFMSFISHERSNASYSRARKAACIKSFFKYLTTKAKLLDTNPAAELESPKIMKTLPRYLNIEESKQLLSSVNGKHAERDFAIITLFLNCGLRLSELVGIDLNKIKNDTLTVIGKGGKERTIYLNEACISAIDAYLEPRLSSGVIDNNALFISERKKRICVNMVQRIVKRYIAEAGLDPQRYSVHKLRHTAATLMYKYGKVDIRTLQKILGHESIATTEIYTHIDDQQLRDAINSNPLSVIKRTIRRPDKC